MTLQKLEDELDACLRIPDQQEREEGLHILELRIKLAHIEAIKDQTQQFEYLTVRINDLTGMVRNRF